MLFKNTGVRHVRQDEDCAREKTGQEIKHKRPDFW